MWEGAPVSTNSLRLHPPGWTEGPLPLHACRLQGRDKARLGKEWQARPMMLQEHSPAPSNPHPTEST